MTPSTDELVPVPAAADAAPAAGAPDADPGAEAEAAAWSEVVAAWDDEASHRAYLARFEDLEGLAVAGGRYRAVLAERPGDPVAARFRDEVVRRALARALATLPRAPDVVRVRRVVRIAAGLVAGAMLALAGYLAVHLLAWGAHA